MPKLMHYDFATPSIGLLLTMGASWFLISPLWAKVLSTAIVVLVFTLFERYTRRIAHERVRSWAEEHHIKEVKSVPRGGFPSWAWTLCTIAEINRYKGVDAEGNTVDILASYHASPLRVETLCEVTKRTDVN